MRYFVWWIGVLEQKLGELASYIVNPIPLARREAMEGSHGGKPSCSSSGITTSITNRGHAVYLSALYRDQETLKFVIIQTTKNSQLIPLSLDPVPNPPCWPTEREGSGAENNPRSRPLRVSHHPNPTIRGCHLYANNNLLRFVWGKRYMLINGWK